MQLAMATIIQAPMRRRDQHEREQVAPGRRPGRAALPGPATHPGPLCEIQQAAPREAGGSFRLYVFGSYLACVVSVMVYGSPRCRVRGGPAPWRTCASPAPQPADTGACEQANRPTRASRCRIRSQQVSLGCEQFATQGCWAGRRCHPGLRTERFHNVLGRDALPRESHT